MTQANFENSTAMPSESSGALYRRTDISPEQFFQTLGRARRAARDEIECLIDWLDSTIDVDQDAAVDDGPCDGDTDAEPSLGSFDRMSDQIKGWGQRAGPASTWNSTGRTTSRRLLPPKTTRARRTNGRPDRETIERATRVVTIVSRMSTMGMLASRHTAGTTRRPPAAGIRA